MSTAHGVGFWLSQIGRDRALRTAPLWIVVTALNTSVLMGVIALRNARDESAVFPTRELTLILGLALAVYLLAGGVRNRCRRIDMTLPLSTQSLWTVHSVASLLAGFLIIGASAGVLVIHLSNLSRVAAFSAGTDVLVGLCAQLAAIWFLAVMVMQSYRTDLKKPTGRRAFLISLTAVVWILASAVFVGEHPLAFSTIATAVGMILGYRTLHSLPRAFSLCPLEVSSQTTSGAKKVSTQRSESLQPAAGVRSRLTSRTVVARSLFHTPPWGAATGWVALLFIAGLGFLLSGVLRAWYPEANVRLWVAAMAVYMLLAFFAPVTFRLPGLDPLPVSRRLLFALIVLPAVVSLALGYAGGWLVQRHLGNTTRTVQYRVEMPHYWVSVPYANLEVAWDGDVPELTSPWGEHHPASSSPLFRGSKAALYSPFNTPEAGSAAFEALLTSRAIDSVHGIWIPPEEVQERYFEVDGDRLVGLTRGGLTLREDYPNLREAAGQHQFLAWMTLVLVPWFLLLGVFLRTFRANLGDRIRQVTFGCLLGLPMLLMLGQIGMAATGFARPDVLRGTLEVLLRQATDSAPAALILAIVCTALVIASYLLAQRQLVKAEIPMTPTKFGLWDISQEY
jgi:diacylglycerol kinase